jgi:hypothetical protein
MAGSRENYKLSFEVDFMEKIEPSIKSGAYLINLI